MFYFYLQKDLIMDLDCKKITIGTLTFDPQEPVSNLHLTVLY